MPDLLDLPSELLYQIIDYIAHSPYGSSLEGKRYRPEHLRNRNVVCYPQAELHISPGLSLLLACRRLNTEATLYSSRNPQHFSLNIAIIDANWLWPTWEHVPLVCKAGTQERLDVNMLYCESENQRGEAHRDVVSSTETFLEVSRTISRLLLQGPLGMASDQPLHGQKGRPRRHIPNLRFRVLNFNIDLQRHNSRPETFDRSEIPFRKIEGLAHLDFDPLYVLDAEKSKGCTEYLVQLTSSALSLQPHGLVLQERVDKIVFISDGKEVAKVDIRSIAERKRERDLAAYRALISQSSPSL